ncbi:SH3 beta-barrel fold-containing protein [uncultured Duncaniella sp.]|jgi:hypothetical protein|uniref:SH3 beta-barrel fold-containing protein n=2 Tax=uncultured Duncaniella sp. TaxID=2768039 RepID=UPI002657FA18|nr:SH3 beta-barrel fold-containing protein [uncultured Duncaniella sp.]
MIDKSKLFRIAHSILKRAHVGSFSEALRLAWKAVKIYAGMLVGEVKFTFRKANGEIREAVGTLCNIEYHPVGGGNTRKDRPAETICFWDVEKHAFRSFNASTLV